MKNKGVRKVGRLTEMTQHLVNGWSVGRVGGLAKDKRSQEDINMVLYNLYLVLNNETIKVYDNDIQSIVYEGSLNHIPSELMGELVHNMTMEYEKDINKAYFLININ